jgi:hypothetical protein
MDRRSNIVNIRNAQETHNNAVNFAIYLHELISNNHLPPHTTLRPLVPNLDENSAENVLIDFVHPHSNHIGYIAMFLPNENERGFVSMLCAINAHNGYFIEITVDTINEVYGVIAFCQNILQYQPDTEMLNYVRIPNHLLNHWCVTPLMRYANLFHINAEQQADPQVF